MLTGEKLMTRNATFVFTAIVCMSISIIPLTHSEAFARMITINDEPQSANHQPIHDLYAFMQEHHIEQTNWTTHWRGSLTKEEEDNWREIAVHDSNMLKQKHVEENSLIMQTSLEQAQVEKWVKQDGSNKHQMTIIRYPENMDRETQFVYEWSGHEIDSQWSKTYAQLEKKIFNDLKQLPQSFSCLEGFSNGKISDNLSDQYNILDLWIREAFDGRIMHHIKEAHFVSVNGHIPEWDVQTLTIGGEEINIQISARYNELDNQTYVTIGYPLILKAH